MNNFFGFNTGSSAYDKRRHLNLIYHEFMYFKLLENQSIAMAVKNVMAKSINERYNIFLASILNKYESNFLYYLKNRYQVPDADFETIIAGETFKYGEVKTPAGYHQDQDWRLVIQMIYATVLTGSNMQPYVQNVVQSYIFPFASGMGIGIKPSSPRIIGNAIQTCLNLGMRSFDDLPRIEDYALSMAK